MKMFTLILNLLWSLILSYTLVKNYEISKISRFAQGKVNYMSCVHSITGSTCFLLWSMTIRFFCVCLMQKCLIRWNLINTRKIFSAKKYITKVR